MTDRLVIDTAKLAGVTVAPHEIDTSHRIGTARPGKDRTIIVRFTSFKTRQEVYNARRELRRPRPAPGSSVSPETASKVFLLDNLTRTNQFLLYQARQLKKANKISAAWSDVGRLKIRVDANGPTRIIKSIDDLEKFAGLQSPEHESSASRPAMSSGVDVNRRVTRGQKAKAAHSESK